MRKKTIGGITITYPETMIYEGDLIYVSVDAAGSDATQLAVTVGGKTAQYLSDGEHVSIEIGSLLRRNDVFGAVNIDIYASRTNPTYSHVLSETYCYCHGRTLPSLYHGSARDIVLPYGSTSVDIPVVAAGKVYVNYALVSTLSAPTIYQAAISDPENLIEVKYNAAALFGDFHKAYSTNIVKFNVSVRDCYAADDVVLGWYDTDGCRRYAIGRLMETRRSAEGVEYAPGLDTIQSPPERLVNKVGEVWTVGFADVKASQRMGEIAMSQRVWVYNGGTQQTMQVIVDGDIATDERRSGDLVLTLKTII